MNMAGGIQNHNNKDMILIIQSFCSVKYHCEIGMDDFEQNTLLLLNMMKISENMKHF